MRKKHKRGERIKKEKRKVESKLKKPLRQAVKKVFIETDRHSHFRMTFVIFRSSGIILDLKELLSIEYTR